MRGQILKKRYPALAVALVASSIGLFVLSNSQGQKPATNLQIPTTAQPEGDVVVEVVMKNDAYEPSEITLKAGQAIRFVNASTGKRWPASNIHPTHELYPDFDPKKELQPGETWTFTFRKTGSWRMHDHLLPYMKGKITVE